MTVRTEQGRGRLNRVAALVRFAVLVVAVVSAVGAFAPRATALALESGPGATGAVSGLGVLQSYDESDAVTTKDSASWIADEASDCGYDKSAQPSRSALAPDEALSDRGHCDGLENWPKGASAIGSAGERGVLRTSAGHGEVIPKTGIARFDEPVVGTTQYARWKANVEKRGYSVVEDSGLDRSVHAEIEGSVITVNPSEFRYIDLLHESRHIRQLERAAQQGIDVQNWERAWFEKGAYEYEQRVLASRHGLNPEYGAFANRQVGKYWKKTYRQKYRFSESTRNYFDAIWR